VPSFMDEPVKMVTPLRSNTSYNILVNVKLLTQGYQTWSPWAECGPPEVFA
jgi:hypothetical protein